MHRPLRSIILDKFKRLSRNIRSQALHKGIISESDSNEPPSFFDPCFDGLGQIEELRDVLRCQAVLGDAGNEGKRAGKGSPGGNGEDSPQREILRPKQAER